LRVSKEPEGQLACCLKGIIHRQEKYNGNADMLSHLPQIASDGDISSNPVVAAVATTAIMSAYSFQDIRPKQLKNEPVDPF